MLRYDAETDQFILEPFAVYESTPSHTLTRKLVLQLIAEASDALVAHGLRRHPLPEETRPATTRSRTRRTTTNPRSR